MSDTQQSLPPPPYQPKLYRQNAITGNEKSEKSPIVPPPRLALNSSLHPNKRTLTLTGRGYKRRFRKHRTRSRTRSRTHSRTRKAA